ncbi:MAG: hypothetical protein B7Z75_06975 [Acidocella sp. 20-57-95]|nr:MAG: hypothetical protein B7Z75_06975 [Acidocella sp. 20-57-95]HQT63583.1 EscU/YscU/HrcU family type III secretion system export apparatus switch protein [Acidocella sp.]
MGEGQDKSHAPSERRLRQAAEQGNVRRSADFPKAMVLLVVMLLIIYNAGDIGTQIEALLAASLRHAGTADIRGAGIWEVELGGVIESLIFLMISLVVVFSILSGGWIFSSKHLTLDFTKLLPSHGAGELFSLAAVTEILKSIGKICLVGMIGALMLSLHIGEIVALAGVHAPNVNLLLKISFTILMPIVISVAILSNFDAVLQHVLHRRGLRMSDAELRDEMKEAVGNPHVRQRQRAMARRMARTRQMQRIPEASVIVTNPSHFSVAIRYRRGSDVAPIMLAKGVGLLAAEIRSRATAYGIPIVEAPPLARAIYRYVEPGDQIPVPLYRACAEILAYVWRMQQWRAAGGMRPQKPIIRPIDIPSDQIIQPL